MVALIPRPPSATTPLAAHAPAFLDSGTAFLRAAERDHLGRKRFGPVVTVNTICLAVEHLLYGLCLSWGLLPEGSCLIGLAAESVHATPLAESATERSAQLSGLLDVCFLFPNTRIEDLRPEDADLAIVWGRELAETIHRALPSSSPLIPNRATEEECPCPTPPSI